MKISQKRTLANGGGQIDVLTGGFPCQPFSYAGQRRGATDDRYLWPFMHKCINEVRPTWVIAENVAGILTMVEQGRVSEMESQTALFGESDGLHRYQQRETFTLERICRDIEADGYEVQPILIPACSVGAPHRRDRVFIIGHRIAPDTDLSANMRGSRKDGSKSKSKRVQERDQVRQSDESNQVRSKSEGNVQAPNSYNKRLEGNNQPRSNEKWKRMYIRRNSTGCSQEIISDTIDKRLQGWLNCNKEGHGKSEDRCIGQLGKVYGRIGRTCGQRWKLFPTVSPVHGGNDGFPFDVDGLTISFSKWRTETLKAYGNAIVPQVMYEIFRAIEKIENND